MKRGVVSIALVMFWLVSGFRFSDVDRLGSATDPDRTPLPVQVGGQSLFPDSDSDGLSDEVEENGWENGAGLFITNPLDRDSDDDGLTDGQEQLFDTSPLGDTSPGIYGVYDNGLKTGKYFTWQRHGHGSIALNSAADHLNAKPGCLLRSVGDQHTCWGNSGQIHDQAAEGGLEQESESVRHL
jgi:hypothetical protein